MQVTLKDYNEEDSADSGIVPIKDSETAPAEEASSNEEADGQ